ncbi:hypothetical protein GJ496_004202 [Pomphorhynchus laevis]|nr:hypothetical protein GJ496_004202 [Pomphorhynchus laevis]
MVKLSLLAQILSSLFFITAGFFTGIVHFLLSVIVFVRILFIEAFPTTNRNYQRSSTILWLCLVAQFVMLSLINMSFHRIFIPVNLWFYTILFGNITGDSGVQWVLVASISVAYFLILLIPSIIVSRIFMYKFMRAFVEKSLAANGFIATDTKRPNTYENGNLFIDYILSITTPGIVFVVLTPIGQTVSSCYCKFMLNLMISLAYSFYAFDYAWTDHSVNIFERCKVIDGSWSYFAGFAFLFTLLHSKLSNSGCYFSSNLVFVTLYPALCIAAIITHKRKHSLNPKKCTQLPIFTPALTISVSLIYIVLWSASHIWPLPHLNLIKHDIHNHYEAVLATDMKFEIDDMFKSEDLEMSCQINSGDVSSIV